MLAPGFTLARVHERVEYVQPVKVKICYTYIHAYMYICITHTELEKDLSLACQRISYLEPRSPRRCARRLEYSWDVWSFARSLYVCLNMRMHIHRDTSERPRFIVLASFISSEITARRLIITSAAHCAARIVYLRAAAIYSECLKTYRARALFDYRRIPFPAIFRAHLGPGNCRDSLTESFGSESTDSLRLASVAQIIFN